MLSNQFNEYTDAAPSISIRPFIGSKDFETSRKFYAELGFEEFVIDAQLSVFNAGGVSFYLQNAYVKDWIENTMLFLEVGDVDQHWLQLQALDLANKYNGVKMTTVQRNDWGDEYHLLDPAGNLLHFGMFHKK